MRVLLVYSNEKARIGGITTWITSLYRALQTRTESCQIFWLGRNVLSDLRDTHNSFGGSLADLLRFVRSRPVDVVHTTAGDWDAGVAIARRASRAKLVVTDQLSEGYLWNSSNCDALISCSAWAADKFQPGTDLPIHVVHNAIDVERFTPPSHSDPGAPIVAWVGRGSALAHKRIDKLASIAPMLRRAGLRIWIADPDGPARVLPSLANELRPLVDFWDEVPFERMPRFLQQVAASGGCVLSTSAYEGLPLSLVEAQACGCIGIGSDVRGVNECVDPARGGALYDLNGSAEELSRLIIDTLKDPVNVLNRRIACVGYVRERFNLTRMVAQYTDIYKSLLAPSVGSAVRGKSGASSPGRRARIKMGDRWPAAHAQYRASLDLMREGEWKLAALAARHSFATCPKVFARPSRFARLLSAMARPKGAVRATAPR